MKFRSPVLFLVNFFSLCTFAHGGGSHSNAPKWKQREIERHAPHRPEPLDHDRLEKFVAAKEIPPDVVTIHCKLNNFTNCRGVEISLYDLNGKPVARAHTGTTGFVGFEGLQPRTEYIAKIESDKYVGEANVRSGGSYALSGERK